LQIFNFLIKYISKELHITNMNPKFSISDLLDPEKMKQHDHEMNTCYKKDYKKITEKKLKELKEKENSGDLNNLDVEGEKLNDWGTEVADEELNPHETNID